MSKLSEYQGYILLMNPETAASWEFEDGEILELEPGVDDNLEPGGVRVVVDIYAGDTPRIIWVEPIKAAIPTIAPNVGG